MTKPIDPAFKQGRWVPCSFCQEDATVQVEDEIYCAEHGADIMAQLIRWWITWKEGVTHGR